MLNQTAEYALRAVLRIAGESAGEPLRVDAIAEALDIPRNYLSKVMHVLARRGILRSMRGPSGGFVLGRPASEIMLAEVIEEFDPLEDRCLLMRRRCSEIDPCVAHARWKDVAVRMRQFFRQTSVADLIGLPAETDAMFGFGLAGAERTARAV